MKMAMKYQWRIAINVNRKRNHEMAARKQKPRSESGQLKAGIWPANG